MIWRMVFRTSAAALVLAVGARAQEQTESLGEQLLAELGLGAGAQVAEVGAGKGERGLEFARAVGPGGRVLLEEIDAKDVESWKEGEVSELEQVEFVLGDAKDPGLPAASFDLVFMERVFHHFTHPREMLGEVRKALKPRGYFVVLDIDRGPLLDRAPFPDRGANHHPLAETTVVRLTREAGFRYVRRLDLRSERGSFLLAFRRTEPEDTSQLPISVDELHDVLPELDRGTAAVILSGPSRDAAIRAIDQRWSGVDILEVALDEWLLPGESLEAPDAAKSWRTVRTYAGVPIEPLPPLKAVIFVDSFNQVFYDRVLLGVLRAALESGAPLVVLDRPAQAHLSRMDYHHRRGVWAKTAAAQLSSAGLLVTGVRTSVDRVRIEAKSEGFMLPQEPAGAELAVSQLLERLIGDLDLPADGKVTLVGDDPWLTPSSLDAAGLGEVWHSTAIGWEGFDGEATADMNERARGPFPVTPQQREASLLIVCDYQDHPEPRWLLDPGMSFRPIDRDGGVLILVSRGLPRSDRQLDSAEEIVALHPGLALVRQVRGAELGRDGEVFWVFRAEREQGRRGQGRSRR